MTRTLGGRCATPGSRWQEIDRPEQATHIGEIETLLDELKNPGANPTKYPGVYTVDVLETLRKMRAVLDAATHDLVQAGHLQYGVSQRALAKAAGISSQTVNKWVHAPEV